MWHVTATKEDRITIVKTGKNRDALVDEVQYQIDLSNTVKDESVQVSKRGFLNWLEK